LNILSFFNQQLFCMKNTNWTTIISHTVWHE
jgi:hypothetical protein